MANHEEALTRHLRRGPLAVCLVVVILVLGIGLRAIGFTRGTAGSDFYHFHPDETTILRAASAPVDPFNPPLTAYGLLPLYAARLALAPVAAVVGWEGVSLDTPIGARRAVLVGRGLALCWAAIALWCTWILGRRCFGPTAGLLACGLLAVLPGAIQQGHFYTVDGPFTALSAAALVAILRAVETGRRADLAVAGALIGLTMAVRLNGGLLALVLVVGLLARTWRSEASVRAAVSVLMAPRLWLAGAVAAIFLLGLQPYLVTDPGRLLRAESTSDFGLSLAIATGRQLQPWTLYDVHTTRYLHHLTELLPRFAGWPFTVACLVALAWGARRRDPATQLLLLWVVFAFVQLGGLHTKHVRYLYPLMPVLAAFVGGLLVTAAASQRRSWRLTGCVAAAAVVLWTATAGLAFTWIYTVEDSRLRARRWLAERVEPGALTGVERGGFSMSGLLDGLQLQPAPLMRSRSYAAAAYMTCGLRRESLATDLLRLDYVSFVDVNRYRQVAAVTDWFPILSEFYNGLAEGGLGFAGEHIYTSPQILGLELPDRDAEPSFVGYDHPTVFVLQRKAPAPVRADLSAWFAMPLPAACPDADLRRLAQLVDAGRWDQAAEASREITRRYPLSKLQYFIDAAVADQRGDATARRQALARFDPFDASHLSWHFTNTTTAHAIPPAAAASLARIGLYDLALDLLRRTQPTAYDVARRRAMAYDVASLARWLAQKGAADHAAAASRIALQWHDGPEIRRGLGDLAPAL